MNTTSSDIVDRGRGPQVSTSRITVLDVFYYLHRGFGFEQIQQAMPTLTHGEFNAIMDYADRHREEMVEKDRQAEDFIQKGIAEHKAQGLYQEIDDSTPQDVRIARLKERMYARMAEKNGDHAA